MTVKRTIFSIFAVPICRSRFVSPTSRSGRMLTVSVSRRCVSASYPARNAATISSHMGRAHRRATGRSVTQIQVCRYQLADVCKALLGTHLDAKARCHCGAANE